MEHLLRPDLPLFINSFSGRFTPATIANVYNESAGALSSGSWPAAGRAIYVPFWLPFSYPIKRVFWTNGATITGTADLGIYGSDFKALFRVGGVAQAGANAPQFTACDMLLAPGSYYLALALSNTAAMFRSTGFSIDHMRAYGFLQEAAAEPLPATMTPTAIATAYVPLCGITRTASGF